MVEEGAVYNINNKNYAVIATYEDFAMLLNTANSTLNGSGDIILVEVLENSQFKVIKDKVRIATIVQKMINESKK